MRSIRWIAVVAMATITALGCETLPERGVHSIPTVRDYRALPDADLDEASRRVKEALRAGALHEAPFETLSAAAYLEMARGLHAQGDREGVKDYAALARDHAESAIRRTGAPQRMAMAPQSYDETRELFDTLRERYETLDGSVAREAAPAQFAHAVTSLSRAEHLLNKQDQWEAAARTLATVGSALDDVEAAIDELAVTAPDSMRPDTHDIAWPEPDPIYFDSRSAELSPEALGYLRGLALFLESLPEAELTIAGHTDDQVSEAQAMALSRRRAQTVHDELVILAPELQVNVTFHGASQPVADNRTEDGRAANRRVELRFE